MCKTAQWHAHGCLANSWYLKENQKSVLTLSIKLHLINRNMVLFPSFTLHKVLLCTSFLDLFFATLYVNWSVSWNKEVNWLGFFYHQKKKKKKCGKLYFGLKDITLSMLEVN